MKNTIIGFILGILFVYFAYKYTHKCPQYWSYGKPCTTCDVIGFSIQDNKFITVEMTFINNPFLLDSNSQFELLFNGKCIYQGQYRENLQLTVPDIFIDEGIMPSIFMQKGKCSLSDTFKGSCFTLNSTCINNGINILFIPENGQSSIFYMSCREDNN